MHDSSATRIGRVISHRYVYICIVKTLSTEREFTNKIIHSFLVTLGSPETKKPKEKQTEEMDDNKTNDENVAEEPADLEVPPPPRISNPSTPPPPKISGDDSKKDKKRKEKSDDKALDVKRKRSGRGKELSWKWNIFLLGLVRG